MLGQQRHQFVDLQLDQSVDGRALRQVVDDSVDRAGQGGAGAQAAALHFRAAGLFKELKGRLDSGSEGVHRPTGEIGNAKRVHRRTNGRCGRIKDALVDAPGS